MANDRVVALLGVGVVPTDAPILRADDLGVLRGDGCFETVHIRAGRPWQLDAHLARMARSAELLELDLPPAADLTELVGQACAAWPADREGALRLVCTRGPEKGGRVTVFATLTGVTRVTLDARRAGIAVRTATLGLPADLRQSAPWLLGGAKTLSYAVNMASQRWAAAAGVDDVLWTSSDGYALEGPTSTLVWRHGSTLCTVPAEPTGILAGTTARWLLGNAGELGLTAADQMIKIDDLTTVDGVWYLSSVRGIAGVRSIDGRPTRTAAAETETLRERLGYPAPGQDQAVSG